MILVVTVGRKVHRVLVDQGNSTDVMFWTTFNKLQFSGYNQIKMHPRDECKTSFMTELSCYCYTVMPFGLKNAGATYYRLMDRVLAPLIGRNVKAYVDDMVVTSQV